MKMKNAKKPKSTKKSNNRTVLVLRTCHSDMTAHNRFKWPTSGPVSAPDWDPRPYCGNGLHGLLWGHGSRYLLTKSHDAKWLVVRVLKRDIVHIDESKVKFPRGEVVYCGDMATAVSMASKTSKTSKNVSIRKLRRHGITVGIDRIVTVSTKNNQNRPAVNAVAVGSNDAMASSDGHGNTAVAYGPESVSASIGDYSSAIGIGSNSRVSARGARAKAVAAAYHRSVADCDGYGALSISTGSSSTSIANDANSKAVAVGDTEAHASSGHMGISVAIGINCRVRAGTGGVLVAEYQDTAKHVSRVLVGYIGTNGLKADTWYYVRNGKFVEAKDNYV